MEQMNRGGFGPANSHQTANSPTSGKSPLNRGKGGDWVGLKYMFLIVIIGSALLMSAVSLFLAIGGNGTTGDEKKYVNSKEYQAVFLNNGQVYFGKISTLNSKTVVINDVFYIEAQANQQSSTSNNNYTLRKLGSSELHKPEDRMVINRDQVTFWENIQDSGRVVQAIQQYKQNPNAANQVQNQDQSSTNSSQTAPTATQNSTGTSTQSTTKKP